MTSESGDLNALWLFNGMVVAMLLVSNVVFQSFTLHLLCARARSPLDPSLGRRLVFWSLGVSFLWIVLGVALGLVIEAESCHSADRGSVWLGVLYPLAIWPAVVLGARQKLKVPPWYYAGQGAAAFGVLLLGAGSCFF